MNELYIGIDMGGTNVKFGCFDARLKLLCKTSVTSKADSQPNTIIEQLTDSAKTFLTDNKIDIDQVKAVGIGAAGQLNLAKGIIISSPNIPLLKNVPFRKMLSRRLGKPVILENDANAACWGEYIIGAGKNVKNMAFLTLGTGIGGGLITDGKIVHGFNDNAAELGHIIIYPAGRLCNCGQRGCAEAYASADSTAKRAEETIRAGADSSLSKTLDKNGKITAKDIYEHLKNGDKLAKKITDETAEILAILCINLLHTTEPQRIVIAGGMAAAGDILLKRIKYYFNKNIWSLKKENVEICFSELAEDAGITGAAALAKDAEKIN